MSTFQHLSGSQKHKKKRELEQNIQKHPKISSYFSHSSGITSNAGDTVTDQYVVSNTPSCSLSKSSITQSSEPLLETNDPKEGCGLHLSAESNDPNTSTSAHISPSSSDTSYAGDTVTDQNVVSNTASSSLSKSSITQSSEPLLETNDPKEGCSLDFSAGDTSSSAFVQKTSSSKDSDTFSLQHVIGQAFVTDRGHYPITITDPNIKKFILAHGPCRPKGPFPRDQAHRRFSENYYETITKTGHKIPITWLCYSPKLNAAYCEPCWLFGDRKKFGLQPAWAKGIQNWQKLSQKIQVHKASQAHMEACVIYDQWRRNKTIDKEQEKQILKEKSFWRQVLQRIINVTLTMAMGNLAFRGHRERLGDGNNGNFLSIIELLACYDHVLKQLLELPQGTIKYLSPKVQNEIILLLAKKVERGIVSDIKSSQFYSVIMDTTQDISKIDQLSQIYRYVTIGRDECQRATEIIIHEAFLGFQEVEDQSAAGLENSIINSIEMKGLTLSKCRGQGYDGAATMSGIYSGVQARILGKQSNALYVHCAAHNLNLVLQDAVACIPEVSRFFDVVQALYVFFGESIKRWAVLSTFTTDSSVTLKRLCPTRWSSRYESLFALRFRFTDIMKALSKLMLTSTKAKEKQEAKSLKKKLEAFEFIFIIVLQSKILDHINSISKMLQSEKMDLSKAAHLICNAKEDLRKYRSNFEDAKQNAILLAEKWGIATKFENKRIAKVKRHCDELCQDERLEDPETRFKTEIFYGSLDIIIAQLTSRFNGMTTVVERFRLLHPHVLAMEKDDELFAAATKLEQYYQEDVSPDFPRQLMSFRSTLRDEICKCCTVKDLAQLLIIDNAALSSTLPDVCTVFLLFLTLPVTVSSAERSFSKLKLIKSFLRSTMSQQRLSGLAILSIENERARELDIESLVDDFAESKARRRIF
ncbi:hypothetical protein XELAEV_18013881mg [Xenopus laevis]|uniref:TTF-type domain-containing protein n=1 Tax=Xenopus laevis TaxID=8355 RepID=A0A974DS45_XENLA|nr:hypothetical protein XELAEV_18013881mg [Xenopus laevis]